MSLQAAQWRIGTRRLPTFSSRFLAPRRNLIPAPTANSGPLMERRADRELPNVQADRRWLRTLPIFAVVVGAAMLGIFNYQKSSSSVVNSTLYALRTSPRAREVLGDEIYFAQQMPWIHGEMNQLHGRIDISFWVKGTKAQGKMKFRSLRPDRTSYVCFHCLSYTLQYVTVLMRSILSSVPLNGAWKWKMAPRFNCWKMVATHSKTRSNWSKCHLLFQPCTTIYQFHASNWAFRGLRWV